LLPQCGHSSPLASRLFSYFHTTHQPRLKSYTAPFTPLLTLHIQGNEFEKTETNHTHPDLHCVFCALKVGVLCALLYPPPPSQEGAFALQDLFANYSYSDEFMIPPTELRRALSVQFAGEARFKIGEMVCLVCILVHSLQRLFLLLLLDHYMFLMFMCSMVVRRHGNVGKLLLRFGKAAACKADFRLTLQIAVLGYLHNVFVGTEGKEDVPCEPMCLVHQVFSMNFCDRVSQSFALGLQRANSSPARNSWTNSGSSFFFDDCHRRRCKHRPSVLVGPPQNPHCRQHLSILFMLQSSGTAQLAMECLV